VSKEHHAYTSLLNGIECVCVYVCVLAEDVEIMSRVLRKFDRDGVVDPQAVELGETILQVSSLC